MGCGSNVKRKEEINMSETSQKCGHGTLWWLMKRKEKNAALDFPFIKNGLISVDDAYRIVLMVDCILDSVTRDGVDPSDWGMESIWSMALATYQEYLNDSTKTIEEDAYPQDWFNHHCLN